MSTRGDRRTFRNEDLVLKVTTNIDPKVWDESRYEAFLDELCGLREYQKEAIRTTLRYLLDVHFVSPPPVECHARVGGHPVPMALGPWIPAFAGMTRGHKYWQCIYETDI